MTNKNTAATALKSILLLLFVGFLWYLLTHVVKPTDIYRLIEDFPPKQLIVGLLISISIWLLRSWRLMTLLQRSGVTISYWSAVKVFVAGQAIAPLPGGEIARGTLIQHESDCDVAQSYSALVTHGLLEFIMAAVLAAVGSLVFNVLRGPALLGLILILALASIILFPSSTENLLKKLPRWPWLKKPTEKLIEIQQEMKKHLVKRGSYAPSPILYATLANALLVNIMGGLLIYTIAGAYGIHLGFVRSIFLYTSSIVVSSLAGIVPGGLGFTEGGMTGILLFSGVALSQSLAIVFVFRMITLGFAIIIGLVFLMLFYGKKIFIDGELFHAKTA